MQMIEFSTKGRSCEQEQLIYTTLEELRREREGGHGTIAIKYTFKLI